MDYQYGNALRPGDIVLMHFRPGFAADLAAFRAAQQAAGLRSCCWKTSSASTEPPRAGRRMSVDESRLNP